MALARVNNFFLPLAPVNNNVLHMFSLFSAENLDLTFLDIFFSLIPNSFLDFPLHRQVFLIQPLNYSNGPFLVFSGSFLTRVEIF